MNRIKISDEEFLYYLNDEWNHRIQLGLDPMWLSTQAFKQKLADRGITISWPTLHNIMERLLKDNKLERMTTSNGTCYKPLVDNFQV